MVNTWFSETPQTLGSTSDPVSTLDFPGKERDEGEREGERRRRRFFCESQVLIFVFEH